MFRGDAERDRIAAELSRTESVVFATLFGSRGSGAARSDSDWDIGIYFDDAIDSEARMRTRARLAAALEPAIQVDLVILNDAPAALARRALDGEILVLHDRRAWVRFFVRTLAAAGDEAYWSELHARERARRLEGGRFGRP